MKRKQPRKPPVATALAPGSFGLRPISGRSESKVATRRSGTEIKRGQRFEMTSCRRTSGIACSWSHRSQKHCPLTRRRGSRAQGGRYVWDSMRAHPSFVGRPPGPACRRSTAGQESRPRPRRGSCRPVVRDDRGTGAGTIAGCRWRGRGRSLVAGCRLTAPGDPPASGEQGARLVEVAPSPVGCGVVAQPVVLHDQAQRLHEDVAPRGHDPDRSGARDARFLPTAPSDSGTIARWAGRSAGSEDTGVWRTHRSEGAVPIR